MTADEDDSLLRYLNRVSWQVISLLDLDARFDAAGQAANKTAEAEGRTIKSRPSLRPPKSARQRPAQEKQEAKSITRKSATRTRRSQQRQPLQHQRRSRKNKSQSKQAPEDVISDTRFEQSFKEDEAKNEAGLERRDQQLSIASECEHEHYLAVPSQQHNHFAPSSGCGMVESIIQLDGGHLSSVNLLTLTMGDEIGQQLDHHQAAHETGNELLASPNTASHLSPIDQSVAQLGSLCPLQTPANYYTSSAAYDEFVGHDVHSASGSVPVAAGLSDNPSSSPSSVAGQGYHQHPAGDTLAHSLVDCYSIHSQQNHHQQQHHSHHHQQHHPQDQPITVHHHYQPHLGQQHGHFDHRTDQGGHGGEQQNHWLAPLVIPCNDSAAQPGGDQHHHHHHHHQHHHQQHNVANYHSTSYPQQRSNYHHYHSNAAGEPHSFQQQPHHLHDDFMSLASATTCATSTTPTTATTDTMSSQRADSSFALTQQADQSNEAESGNGLDGSGGNNNNLTTSNPQQHQCDASTNHHAHHQLEHHHQQPTLASQPHAQSHHHQHHHQPQQQQMISSHPHMMHHHLHAGHMMPTLGPFVNGIEPSSVILHDINLASASWSSPEDLYSI